MQRTVLDNSGTIHFFIEYDDRVARLFVRDRDNRYTVLSKSIVYDSVFTFHFAKETLAFIIGRAVMESTLIKFDRRVKRHGSFRLVLDKKLY